uniref:Succinyl-CoA:glutarate-CoA transferase n=1 Tax=Gasterosteus aculeatus aculeatus TaxID=481459 RepID=A0AAQ4R2G1_GASAC
MSVGREAAVASAARRPAWTTRGPHSVGLDEVSVHGAFDAHMSTRLNSVSQRVCRVLAGPFATMILGDLGAQVIKVERPGAGDDTRTWGPPFVGAESAYFLSVNRNKKSISVDLKHPRGVGVIQELAAVCDVLVENFLPGKLPRLGLGYEQLCAVNPGLVYCSISGYGQTGPRAQSPGYDSIASAVSGMMHITGSEDGEPVRPGVAMTDLATGLYAHGAVMAALLQRHKTGRGVHIDCNLLSSQGSLVKDSRHANMLSYVHAAQRSHNKSNALLSLLESLWS